MKRLVGGAALAIGLLFGGGQAAGASEGEVGPGCIPRADGFMFRLCLETPPPLGQPARVGREERDLAILLESLRVPGADLSVEPGISGADRAAIAAALLRDLAAVEREYGRSFAGRPVVQVFARASSFEVALRRLFGYPANVARMLAFAAGAMDRPSGSIVINWQRVSGERPVSIIRHELTHLMVRQIVGVDTALPAWFDEGLATLSQYALADRGAGPSDDYVAAAVLSTQSLSVAQLVTSESWLRAAARVGTATYAVAGSAAETVRADVGSQGLVRILELTGSGMTFEEAFAAVAGRSVASFTSTVGGRIGERALPEIAVGPLFDARGDLSYVIRGFPPTAPLEVTIDGVATGDAPYHLVFTVTTDAAGRARGTFGSTAPPGTYAIRAKAGALAATAVLRTAR